MFSSKQLVGHECRFTLTGQLKTSNSSPSQAGRCPQTFLVKIISMGKWYGILD